MGMIAHWLPLSVAELQDVLADPGRTRARIRGWHGEDFTLEKGWHGVHFLLTGSAWQGEPPLADAVLGGQPIGEHLVYGPATYLSPSRVAAVADALGALPDEELAKRFDPENFELADIYPGHWDDREAVRFLLGSVRRLRDFYRKLAGARLAVLKHLD
ncbi:MAG TPA: YfbM family protein [Gemmataceae bacterium]|jgi:hypothetical protein